MEEYIKNEPLVMNSEWGIAKKSIQAVCKKILEEVQGKITEKRKLNFTFPDIDDEELKQIIKDLGVEI